MLNVPVVPPPIGGSRFFEIVAQPFLDHNLQFACDCDGRCLQKTMGLLVELGIIFFRVKIFADCSCKETNQISSPKLLKLNILQLLTCARLNPLTSVSAGRKSLNCPALAISACAWSSIHCLMFRELHVALSLVPIFLHLSWRRIRVEPVWDEHRELRSQSSSSCCLALILSWACRGGVNC